jgi:aryl-alcohol dehydrogenase-like predicted oxidoreductase
MGRTGLKVSELCVGTMTFGHGTDEAEARRIVDLALDAGVNFFDTANSYGNGESEVLLGKALKGRRRGSVVATKFFNPMRTGPNDSGMSRAHIMQAIEETFTTSTMSTPKRRWRRCCGRSTIWCARGKCATSPAVTTRRGD